MTASRAFVLVHGAWHGGWCWERVAELLRRNGHRVFTPTLTGLAERAHLLSPQITLATHIRDVVDVFQREDLQDAILVGHSFGGWVVSGATEELRSRIDTLVFVDAHVPTNGQVPLHTSHHRAEIELALSERRAATPPRRDAARWFQVNEQDRDWVQSKLTAQPVGVYLNPIHLTGAREAVPHKAYVRARRFPSKTFADYYTVAQTNGWRVDELDCGHDIMIDEPAQLTAILQQICDAPYDGRTRA